MTFTQVLQIREQTASQQGRAILDSIGFLPLPSKLKPGFKKLIEGRDLLRKEYLRHAKDGGHEGRDFSLDGRLVGDLGELVVAMISPIILTKGAGPKYDAHLKGKPKSQVQIRCSLRDDSIAIKHGEGHFIAIQLLEDNGGQFRVVYDGPALKPWIYVNATKKTGKRDANREATTDKLKPLKLTTWALLNMGIDERFVKP